MGFSVFAMVQIYGLRPRLGNFDPMKGLFLRVVIGLQIAGFMGCAPTSQPADGDTLPTRTQAGWAKGLVWWGDPASPDAVSLSNPRTGEPWAVVFRDSSALRVLPGGPPVVVGNVASNGLATLSTTHVALMAIWDPTLASWAGGAYVNFLRNEIALEQLAAGAAMDFSGQPELDKERLLAANPAALTIYPFGDPLAGTSVERQIPVVPIGEYLEPHPLGRAEWMLLFGWLAGELPRARTAFSEVAQEYESIRQALTEERHRPKVFTGSVRNGVWHAPGAQSLVAQFIADAGLENLLEAQSDTENIEIPLEQMLQLSQEADAWGVVWDAPEGMTWSTLEAADARYALLAPPSGRVFAANTAVCDYFGDWVARPDEMLRNLAQLFHPDVVDPPQSPCFKWLTDVPSSLKSNRP